ncbi:hypothetical protein BH11PAT1_BH11PAT1_7700 [soil metagenome]
MATINISLPKGMYEDVKKTVKKKEYTSVSELIRDSLRKMLYPELTVNGFTKEFEDEVLRSAAEPIENDYVLETDEDIDNYFRHLILPKKKTL